MIEVRRYKLKDVVKRKLDLGHSFRMVKWRRNKLNCKLIVKSFKWGILCSVRVTGKVSNTSLRLGQ